jgi:hypothetical protein
MMAEVAQAHLLHGSRRSQQKVKKGRRKGNTLLETIRERKETKTRLGTKKCAVMQAVG